MNSQYEIGGLPSCRENARSLACLVARAVVLVVSDLVVLHRQQQDSRGWLVELPHLLVHQGILASVVSRSLEVESVDVTSILGLDQLLFLDLGCLELERKGINRNLVLSRVGLQEGREESLWEEEAANPIG